ncbi:hypothetical protein E4U19_002584 [Claviceps sp. Clav32 group G5]|nr:hypothetical protein E4U19_002584 [Claviceps sp. Clav32 group G5]
MTTFLEKAPENTTESLSEPCSADGTMYALQDIPGKGKGLVATREIPKGTRILAEQPLMTLPVKAPHAKIPELLARQWETVNVDQRTAFLSLHNKFADGIKKGGSQFIGIFSSNCREFGPGGSKAVYLEASRINHDCEGNAEEEWNSNIKRLTVHAIRDIHVGEEITICYGAGYHDTQASMQKNFEKEHHFVCACHTCTLPAEQREERDRKLLQISSLRWYYTNTTYKCRPIRSLQYLDSQARIYSELNRQDLGFALVFELAADLVISHGDLARGRIFAQKAESMYKILLGSDNPMTIKFADMARDPSRHDRYGLSIYWGTFSDDIPYELEPHDFEEWLWRRDKQPMAPAKALIPPKQSFFSAFVDLPYKGDIGTNSSFKKHHWCFLGQIMEPLLIVPLDLHVMDVRGKKLRVHFYTDKRGEDELPPKEAQLGHTVAVLDAIKHDFEFGPPGIRLQDARMIKSFPLPLTKILELVNEFRQFSKPQHNDCRNCHGCGNSAAAASMKRCSGCLSFWYCSKDCQMVGWVTKGHKASCKFLKDPDLRSLLLTEWDGVQDSVSFPLKVATGSC